MTFMWLSLSLSHMEGRCYIFYLQHYRFMHVLLKVFLLTSFFRNGGEARPLHHVITQTFY
jgi:hypothetical protein